MGNSYLEAHLLHRHLGALAPGSAAAAAAVLDALPAAEEIGLSEVAIAGKLKGARRADVAQHHLRATAGQGRILGHRKARSMPGGGRD